MSTWPVKATPIVQSFIHSTVPSISSPVASSILIDSPEVDRPVDPRHQPAARNVAHDAGDALRTDVQEAVAHHHHVAMVEPPVDPVLQLPGRRSLLRSCVHRPPSRRARYLWGGRPLGTNATRPNP